MDRSLDEVISDRKVGRLSSRDHAGTLTKVRSHTRPRIAEEETRVAGTIGRVTMPERYAVLDPTSNESCWPGQT